MSDERDEGHVSAMRGRSLFLLFGCTFNQATDCRVVQFEMTGNFDLTVVFVYGFRDPPRASPFPAALFLARRPGAIGRSEGLLMELLHDTAGLSTNDRRAVRRFG